MKKNKKIGIIVIGIIMALGIIALLSTYLVKKVDKTSKITNPQDLKSMTYNKVTDQTVKSTNGEICEFVEFSTFFTQDLNKDGIAERVDGACREISDSAQLYFNFRVISKGYLKNGKIEINGKNFRLDTAIVADNIISKNYIESDTKQIDLVEKVYNGSQKEIVAQIKSTIDNINDYSRNDNSVTFSGTYVYEDEDGNEVEVPISKTSNLTVDWYGTTSSAITTADVLNYSNDTIVNSETGNIDLSFEIETRETQQYDNRLLLDSNVVIVKLPNIKGISPISAKAEGTNIIQNYNLDTQELTITRKSTIDEEGNITTSLSPYNTYKITLTYPKEIYDESANESVVITVPVQSYYTAYNNPGEEFKNEIAVDIAKSNIAEKSLAIAYEKPTGDVFEFDVKIGEYVTYPYSRYVVSKKETIKEYNNIESEVKDTYEVRWIFKRGPKGTITKTEMNYTKADELNNNNSLEDCTPNIGIYIDGAKAMLGENGYIKVYDADKTGDEALIAVFTQENWEKYTKENPYYYENPVKNIKVETSESAQSSTLIIHNVKEIDNEVLASKQSKAEFDKLNLIYTNLTGKVYEENSEEIGLENRTEVAYYEDEESKAYINISSYKVPTTETTKNEIIIQTIANGYNESKWQNGEFLLEMPENITLMEINSVSVDNENIKILGYNIFEENGKYFIKVITQNNVPDTYSIKIDCEITPNSRMATSTSEVKLYAYNEYYENYEKKIKDIYDANNNGNVEENVGFDKEEIQFISPTGLITYQIATNYDDEQEGETTIAPKIAEVKKEQRSVQINLDVINNYSSTISDTKILGKIPFEGNTYIITNGKLGSQFTTNITSKVVLDIAQNNTDDFTEEKLNELKNNLKIYYSTNENPTKDLEDELNGWIEEENVTDWSNIKTYFIDLGEFVLDKADSISFKYEISIPEGIDYEQVSYSSHAVYFNLDTPDGKLADYTEPNKLGIKIARKYNIKIQKNEIGRQNKVQNALYLLEAGKKDDITYESYIQLTDSNGQINIDNLYVGKVYKLTEIKSTDEYELSTGTLEFKVIENDETKELEVQILTEGAGYKTNFASGDNINILVEDRIRYNITFNKYRSQKDQKIKDITYTVQGKFENEVKTIKRTTNESGEFTLENLFLDEIYTIKELYTTEGFALADGELQFKVMQNKEDGNLSVQIINNGAGYKNYEIDQIAENINLNVEDDVRYKLKLNKKDTQNNNIPGVKYQIQGAGVNETKLTDKDGNIEISKLKINEHYTVTEITATGYYINEPFDIYVTKNENGDLQTNIGTITDNENGVLLNIQAIDEKIPTYDLEIEKVEKNNKDKKLPDVTFKIEGKDLDKTVTTDENGKILLTGLYQYIQGKDIDGIYTITETVPANGYILESEVLKIQVSNDNGLKVNILQGEDFIYSSENESGISVDGNKVNITLVNSPVFKIIKRDSSTKLPIANAKFAIYKITYNEDGTSSKEPAKDVNGNIIGIKERINNKDYYIVTTQDNGEITADLPEGLYCLEEIQSADGYVLPENEENRINYFGIGQSKEAVNKLELLSEKTLENQSYLKDIEEVDDGYIVVGVAAEDMQLVKSDETNITVNYGESFIIKYDKNFKNLIWCTTNSDGFVSNIYTDEDGNIITKISECINKYDKDGNLIKNINLFEKLRLDKFSTITVEEYMVKLDSKYIIVGDLGEEDTADSNTVTITTQEQGEKILSAGDFILELDKNLNIINYFNRSDDEFSIAENRYNLGYFKFKNYAEAGWFNEETTITTEQQGSIIVKNATVVVEDENGNYKWAYSLNSESIDLMEAAKLPDGGAIAFGTEFKDETITIDGKEYNLVTGSIAIHFDENGKVINILNGKAGATQANSSIIDSQGRYIAVGYKIEQLDESTNKYYAEIQVIGEEQVNPEYVKQQEITIENDIKKFKITTEVKQGEGTIDGEGQAPYEVVEYMKDSTLPIIAKPADGWNIKKITINSEVVDYDIAEDGSVTLPQFTKMTEDKHIAVWFVNPDEDYNFELTKTNEDGVPLANAKFTVKKVVKDADGNETLYDAKDIDGNLVGYDDVIDGEKYRVVESDENGRIRLNLENGNYRLVEVKTPIGYELLDNKYEFFIYEINYIEDLVELSNIVNTGKIFSEQKIVRLERTLDFEEVTSYRNSDDKSYGDLNENGIVEGIKEELTDKENGIGFTPIGNSKNHFSGTFNGQGYEIRNLYINITSSSNVYAGLFGCLDNAEIKKIGITGEIVTNNNINGTYRSNFYNYTGGIAGYATNNSSIIDCYNICKVNSSSKGSYNYCYAGGIAGYISNSNIINSFSRGEISGTSNQFYCYTGGVVGELIDNSSINNCYNIGIVKSNSQNHTKLVGGIAGDIASDSNISNCYNIGDINCSGTSSDNYVGGISGKAGGSISNCYNEGRVTNTGESNYNWSRIGGIAGYADSVSNCYNIGEISSIVNNYNYVGGIAGYADSISNCYNIGKVIGNSSSKCTAGGIVGFASLGNVINCFNTGAVDSKSNSKYSYAGGIVGDARKYNNYSSSINNNYNVGSVNSTSNLEISYAGGIIGAVEDKNGNVIDGSLEEIVEISNIYYSNNIAISADNLYSHGEILADEYMKSKEFVKLLNDNIEVITSSSELLDWNYINGDYPKINIDINIENITTGLVSHDESIISLNVLNKKKLWKVTTEILENSENRRNGGTITGVITNQENINFVENVFYGENSKINIRIYPDKNYKIKTIYIDGTQIDFTPDQYGNVTLDKFTNVTQDHHVQVIFEKVSTFKLIKKDTDGNILSGAKFTIKKVTENNGELIEADAIDIEGNIVGTQENINGEDLYVVTTDENGEINANLPNGNYRLKEVKAPDGYYLADDSEQEFCIENKLLELEQTYSASSYVGYTQSSSKISYRPKLLSNGDRLNLDSTGTSISRYNADGRTDWSTNLKKSGTGSYNIFYIEETKNGDILVFGSYSGTLTIDKSFCLDKTEDIVFETGATGYYKSFIIRLNSKGNIINAFETGKITSANSSNYYGLFANALSMQEDGSYVIMLYSYTSNETITFLTNETIDGKEISKVIPSYYVLVHYSEDDKVIDVKGLESYSNSSFIRNIVAKESGYVVFYQYELKVVEINEEGISTDISLVVPPGFSMSYGNVLSNGNYAACGYVYSSSGEITIYGDYTADGKEITLYNSGSAPDPVIVIYNEVGKIINAFDIDCNQYGYFNSVVGLSNGDIVAVGYENNGIEVTSDRGLNGYTYSSTTSGGLVVQFTSDGDIVSVGTASSNLNFVENTGDKIIAYYSNNAYVYSIAETSSPVEMKVENSKSGKVIVHHYLKNTDGTYTTIKVSPDETKEDVIGNQYTTSPKTNLTDVALEKDKNGGYIIPTNATGEFKEEIQEITYYYEPKEITLTINHYLEGTETPLVSEEKQTFKAQAIINDDGTYTITANGKHDIDENDNYNKLKADYILTSITSDVENHETPELAELLEFSKDTNVTYYYKQIGHVITTQIQKHNEIRTDEVTKEKTEVQIEGGKITGEYVGSYKEEKGIRFVENVLKNKDSITEIKAEPDLNYMLKQIKLVSTNDEGIQTESIIYGENAVQNAEITATEDEEGNVTLTTFKTVTENKHIIVEFAPIQGTVIVHHYIEGTGEEFGTKAIKVPSKEEGKVVEDETKQDYIGEKYATKQSENIAPIYELVSTSGETSGEYIDGVKHVYYYYNLKDYKYTIHYFYDGIEDITKIENGEAEYGAVITKYPDKPDGYTFQKVEPVNNEDSSKTKLSITNDESKNVINVYYATPYKITTDVIEHTEEYTDGAVKENVKGGNISGELTEENNTPYEVVFKGKQPQNAIKITPTKTDEEEYEIVKVIVKNNREDETGITVNLEEIEKAEDGSIILPTKYLADPEKGIQSDKHVEVEFRKKTNVIIKHLEKGTGQVLYTTPEGKDYEEITGYEGQSFETTRKAIEYYMASEVGITDENNDLIEKYKKVTTDKETYVDGTMYADTLTIIYWYERIPAGIIIKHIEINEQDKKEGLTLQSGTVLDEELLNGFVSLTEDTERKIYSEESGEVKNEKYKNYISVDGPQSTDENLIIVGKDENTKEVIYKQESTIEVRYYYEKQHKLTTEVKPHTETIDGAEKLVDGGTISKEYITDSEGNKQETTYEIINHRGYNKKQIEITPNAGYRAKQITIQNVSKTGEIIAENIYARTDFEEDSNNKITLKSGEINEDDAYFKDVQKDIHVIVEFERIPAKVIVEYRDVDTGEIIPGTETKTIEKFVGDKYETEPKNIENYAFVEERYPSNCKGTMTQEDITVVYWYTKQYKITTDVIEHTEVDKDGNVSKQKGGSITAEDENPYELVNRGNSNTLEIEIEPFSGHKIKEIQINGKVVDYINDENIVKEGNKVKIPSGYFNNMREDKHITVEYERIPSVVKVQYLEEETEKVLYTTPEGIEYEKIDGYVNETYETKEKEIENYELVQEKYPTNSTGTMAEEEIIVKYYYKKALFNMKVEKEIEKVTVIKNEEEKAQIVEDKSIKVSIKYKKIEDIAIEVSYKIKVTNTEKVSGTAILEEDIPEGFEFVADKSDAKWKNKNGKFVLETEEIKPEETKEYMVTLKWIPTEGNKGQKVNTVKIAGTYNKPDYKETTKEDNEDKAVVEINLEKEIEEIISDVVDDIIDGKPDEAIDDVKHVVENVINGVKTGDSIAKSVIVIIIAVSVLTITITLERKEYLKTQNRANKKSNKK